MSFTPGSLVNLRDRDWVVMPSDDPDLLLVKPLGGSEEETTGIYLPLAFPDDKPKQTVFPRPTVEDLGDFTTTRLLYDAARLSFATVLDHFGRWRSFHFGRVPTRWCR